MTFEEWVRARGTALLRFALMVTANRGLAEDLVQTVLARTYVSWDYIGGLDSPEAYIKASIVNEHLKWWRRRSNREVPVESPAAGSAYHLDLASAHASRDAAWELLRRLPRKQRAVLALRYYEDLSDDAIGSILGCTASTVRSQAARALATLRLIAPTISEEARP